MNTTPRVSVIIPVYNAEKYLKQCLSSVLEQTFQEFEIICVDDGSTDGSARILDEFAQKYSSIKVIHQQNLYAGVARNNGLRIASGEYVFFLDGDDFCDKNLLSLAVKTADNHNADIVVFDHFRVNEATGAKEKREDLSRNLLPKNIDTFSYQDVPNRILSIINPVPWNKLLRRDFLLKNGLHFEALSSTNDVTFSAMCAACASKIAYLPKPLIYYRVNLNNSITSTKQYKLDNVLAALLATYKQAKLLPYFEKIRPSVQYFIVSNLYYAITNYAGESSSELYKDFYSKICDLLGCHPLFWGMTKESLSNDTLWKFFNSAISDKSNSFDRKYLPKVIVSLTSYPKRINTVYKTIQTMLNQTEPPDEILLWLAKSQFPNLENDLPASLLQILSDKVKIKWTKDIKSYKKLIPALTEYPDDIIITVDDDLLFDEHIIERLLKGYRKYPHCIQCHRVTTIEYHDINNIKITPDALKVYPVPTYLHKLSGGAGCLYPPHSLHPDALREDLFMSLASTSDDIWFWLMGALNGYKVNVVENNIAKLKYIPGTQDEALWKVNDKGEKLFFIHLKNILCYYPILMDVLKNEQILLGSHTSENTNKNSSSDALSITPLDIRKLEAQVSLLQQQNRLLQHEIASIHQSWTYRSGRFITWVPRMLRGLIFCYKENGFNYTVERILVHLRLKKDDSTEISTNTTASETHSVKEQELIKNATSATVPPVQPQKRTIKRDYDYYRNLPPEKYEEELKLWFERVTKSPLNLDNPQTYNEKIQWLKLYDSTPLKTRLADKYLVREWITEQIGSQYLVPLLGVWDDFDDIDFDKLPNQFVLKANHGSGWNYIVKDKSKMDLAEARGKFNIWMHKNFAFSYGLELQYMNIPPKIIAEQYIEEINQVYDYKFMCFDGEVKFIWVDTDRFTDHKRTLFTTSWERMPERLHYQPADYEIPRPQNLDKMLEFAEKLSQGFAHVRVDFYEVKGKLYFGEMTFTFGSGTDRPIPNEFGYTMGSWLKLPPKSPLPQRTQY